MVLALRQFKPGRVRLHRLLLLLRPRLCPKTQRLQERQIEREWTFIGVVYAQQESPDVLHITFDRAQQRMLELASSSVASKSKRVLMDVLWYALLKVEDFRHAVSPFSKPCLLALSRLPDARSGSVGRKMTAVTCCT